MKKLLVILLASLMLFSVFGCKSSNVEELAVCVGSEPATIDPALNSAVDGATMLVHLFEGLYKLDETGMPVPGQATGYELSDDMLTYTFTLRDDIFWSDGEPVTAADFEYAWKRAADPATGADYGYMFEVIDGFSYDEDINMAVTALDDLTLEVKVAAPCNYFLELVAFPTYFPVRQDIIEANMSNGEEIWATDPATYVCNGPYALTEWSHDSYILVSKNQEYYDVDNIGPETIKFVLMDDANAMLAAFKTGELLLIDDIPTDEIASYSEDPEFYKKGQLGTYYVSFNTEYAPFDDPMVREALSLVIDRNYIVEQIGQAGQIPATAFVPTGMSDADTTQDFRTVGGDYYSASATDYEANCEQARALLADAGYPDGAGFPVFTYLYNTSTGHQAIGEALQQMWKEELNIDCTLESQEWNTFLETRKDGNYQVARDGWLGDYNDPITFLDLFTSMSGNNNAQWKNADFDALIASVKVETDRATRYQMMHDAEDLLMGDSVVAPIYYYVDIYLLSDSVEGFYSSPFGYKYFMFCTVN